MKSESGEVIGILSVTVLFYTLVSFLNIHATIPDLLSDIKHNIINEKPTVLNTQSHTGIGSIPNNKDSLHSAIKADSTVLGFGDLTLFFNALDSLKQRKQSVHVAYFGDSMIEGDLLTMDLRAQMQEKFGGSGVGFVPITSQVAGFRSTIRHSFNSSWINYHFNEKPPPKIALGISGYSFKGQRTAQVNYMKNKFETDYRKAVLFYSTAEAAKIQIKTDSSILKFDLPATDSTVSIKLIDSSPYSKISIEVLDGEPVFYGVSLEKTPGIYIDNFSFRGNSGIPLVSIPANHLKSIDKNLNYKLIVLHFGLNVVGHNTTDYSWYIKPFKKTIQHIKNAFPSATIILASVGDKSYFDGSKWNTEPDIPRFVDMQAKLAADENICFWNLYKAMGGYNSMKKMG